MKNFGKAFVFTMILMVIVGCGKQVDKDIEITEDIYNHLEETVIIEEDFESIQVEINELERSDQDLYNKMTELGNAELAELSDIANEAIELLEERLELIEAEKSILADSKTEFVKTEPLIGNIENESKKTVAESLSDAMINRYEAYNVVYDKYTTSIIKTKELYTLFKEEEFNEEAAYSLINDVNNSYEEVMEANEKFNAFTVEYNDYKKELYEILNKE